MGERDRELFRREAALQLACAQVSNPHWTGLMEQATRANEKFDGIPEQAVKMADELIRQLEKP